MPLMAGPVRLPVDLPYLDRYCYLEGGQNGGVLLLCRSCAAGYPVAWLGDPSASGGIATVDDITSLIDAGMRHLAEYHPEP